MALTFPREFPAWLRATSCRIRPSRIQALSRSRGGTVQVAERGRTLMTFEATFPAMRRDRHAEIEAWIDSLRDGLNTFRAHHLLRCRPLAYPGTGWAGFTKGNGGGAFTGANAVIGSSPNPYTAVLGDLPGFFVLSPGDMISWAWKSTRTIHRIVEGGTADNVGTLAVQVEPDIPPGNSLAYPLALKVERADAIWRLVPPYPDLSEEALGQPVTIRAVQVLF
ncbi:MAG TPA: hypothetical protein VM434_00590 [Beijerinckiaceae bacterium]|nr:hypothetical protein [Beijerinckiaceae bacterium]